MGRLFTLERSVRKFVFRQQLGPIVAELYSLDNFMFRLLNRNIITIMPVIQAFFKNINLTKFPLNAFIYYNKRR